MPFGVPDIELPAHFELPRLVEKPRDKRLDNLRHGPGFGRPKGAPDKICRDLKQGILRGAEACGHDGEGLGGVDGFLLMCAQRYPKHYLALMGKLLPLNTTADVNKSVINEVRIISVPTDHYFPQGASENNPGALEYIPPSEPIAPIKQAEHAPVDQAFEPQTERERQLLAELEALSHEELVERAKQAGFVDVDGG